MNIIRQAIMKLPDNPDTEVIWCVYNEDMRQPAIDMIKEIKGENYMTRCRVVSRDKFDVALNFKGNIYYSPDLYDHVGNGAN